MNEIYNDTHMKRTLPFIILILLVAGGIGALSYFGSRPSDTSLEKSESIIAANDWVAGNKDANVVLVEYSDFQCPACGAYHPLVKQLVGEMGNDFAFIYRHFPLQQHTHAKLAAYAAEAAGNQGKFWDMHAMIFEHQRDWSDADNARDTFIGYAESLGIDRSQFEKDMDSDTTKDKVASNYSTGVKLRVAGTPTFFLNGKKMETPRSYEEFKKRIQDEIAAKK